MNVHVPEEYGGPGLSIQRLVIARETLLPRHTETPVAVAA
jgi:hypothetical protein